jgi:hypothetical protein
MTDAPERRYGDREVRLILKAAADLQRRAAEDASSAGGMSLSELEQVASEAGIDPALIRRAAADLDVPSPRDRPNRFLGSPTEIIVERTTDVPLDPENFDRMLDVVRATTRAVGEVSTVGRQFGWKGRLHDAKTDVSISAGEARTTFRVRIALDELAVGHFMLKGTMFGVGGGLGTAALASSLGFFAPIVGLGVAGTGYLWARRGLARSAETFRQHARDLVDALAARAAEIGPRSPRLKFQEGQSR